ncbi:MAG: hypothetical protein U5K54_27100 [Cytophagales bacterium]|nr:hypothetical protein [Cytophagales bacterium]
MEAWLEVAKNELNGADPIKELTLTKGTLKIKPYYQSISEVNQHDFSLLPSVNPYYGPRCWLNIPRIIISMKSKQTKKLCKVLQTGPMEFY